MPLNMWRPSIIKLTVGGVDYYLSDHNRSPVSESYEVFEKSERTANATLRKYVVTSKRQWSTDWEMLPGISSQTVDGYMGALDLKNFYDINLKKPITLTFYSGRMLAVPSVTNNITWTTSARTYAVPLGHGLNVGELVSYVGTGVSTYNLSNARITSTTTTSFTVAVTSGSSGNATQAGTLYQQTQAKGLASAQPSYTATVFISDFSREIQKRYGDVDYWSCSIGFTEV